MSFAARTDRLGTMTVVVLTGEPHTVVLDLSGLSFLDSTGVRVLLTADLRARKRGVRFGVARSTGMVRRLLEVTRIEERFPVVDDPAELAGQ